MFSECCCWQLFVGALELMQPRSCKSPATTQLTNTPFRGSTTMDPQPVHSATVPLPPRRYSAPLFSCVWPPSCSSPTYPPSLLLLPLPPAKLGCFLSFLSFLLLPSPPPRPLSLLLYIRSNSILVFLCGFVCGKGQQFPMRLPGGAWQKKARKQEALWRPHGQKAFELRRKSDIDAIARASERASELVIDKTLRCAVQLRVGKGEWLGA